jgi:hypothetical protein
MARFGSLADEERKTLLEGLGQVRDKVTHKKPKAELHPMLQELWQDKVDKRLAVIDRLIDDLMRVEELDT